jgi:uncharacterized damage-inducible protein DinB
MTVDDVRALFAYDEWANARFFKAAAGLGPEQWTRRLTSSFSSLQETLAHIVMAEWVWLRRWKGESPTARPSWASEADVAQLREALSAIERERAEFVAGLTDARLEGLTSYRTLKGEEQRGRLSGLCQHVVNHSTYHRGQAATLLRQVGATVPSTDLVVFTRQAR